jgi:ABC-type spermidine/putrescine transport system permease subunit II
MTARQPGVAGRLAGTRGPSLGWSVVPVLTIGFLLVPMLVVVLLSFSSGQLLEFPPPGLSLKWYRALLADQELVDSLRLSLWIAAWTSTVAVVMGTAAAYALGRHVFPGRGLVQVLFLAPLVIPYVVLALGLLRLFSLLRLRGSVLSIVIGHVVIVLPFVVLLVLPGFALLGRSIEEAAVTLGANRLVTFFRIVAPLIKRNITAAWVFAFIVSFDEFVVAYFLSGPLSTTLPVKMYAMLSDRVDPGISALSTLTVLVAVVGTLLYLEYAERSRRGRGDRP